MLSSSCNAPNKRPLLVVDGYTGSLIESTLLAGTTYSEYRAIVCCLSSGATSGQMVIALPTPGDSPQPSGGGGDSEGESCPPPQEPSCPDIPLLQVLCPIFQRTLDLSQRLERLACNAKWMAIAVIVLLLLCLILLFLLLKGS